MKKPINNNKYRHNNGGNYNNSNHIYSLNYKFDSNSIAGKCSGTALDLIKRYNELARDAQNSNDVVNAEIFRQYAEHYRKIVTDINDKKNVKINYFKREENQAEATDGNVVDARENPLSHEAQTPIEVQNNLPNEQPAEVKHEHKKKPLPPKRREFTIIEVKESSAEVKNAKAKEVETKAMTGQISEENSDKKTKLKTTRTPRTTKKAAEETIAAV